MYARCKNDGSCITGYPSRHDFGAPRNTEYYCVLPTFTYYRPGQEEHFALNRFVRQDFERGEAVNTGGNLCFDTQDNTYLPVGACSVCMRHTEGYWCVLPEAQYCAYTQRFYKFDSFSPCVTVIYRRIDVSPCEVLNCLRI